MPTGASSQNTDVPAPFDACDPVGTFVFVSYAHTDKTLAYPELERIRSHGVRVWYDEGIEPGSEWPEAIASALDKAAAFVVLITPAAVASRNVRNEINAALSWGKPFFAIHLEQTKLPLSLELQMGHVQAVMCWEMDEGSYARKLGKVLAGYVQAGNAAPAAGPAAPVVPSTVSRVRPLPVPAPVLALRLARSLEAPTHGGVHGVAFSPDGRLLAAGSYNSVWLWDPATGVHVRTLDSDDGEIYGVAFSPDGRLLATGSHYWRVRLWDPATGENLRTLKFNMGPLPEGVAFSPDGRLLAINTEDHRNAPSLWDPATGELLRTLTGHTKSVEGVAFSPDGQLIATASCDKTVRLWDPATGEHLRTLAGHTSEVVGVAFSPDGQLIATASSDETARLWDPATGRHLALTGHGDRVQGVAFSPDGRLLATASWDKTVRLWDSATGEHLQTLTGHARPVQGVAFSPDGRLLATGSWDKTVRLWNQPGPADP